MTGCSWAPRKLPSLQERRKKGAAYEFIVIERHKKVVVVWTEGNPRGLLKRGGINLGFEGLIGVPRL